MSSDMLAVVFLATSALVSITQLRRIRRARKEYEWRIRHLRPGQNVHEYSAVKPAAIVFTPTSTSLHDFPGPAEYALLDPSVAMIYRARLADKKNRIRITRRSISIAAPILFAVTFVPGMQYSWQLIQEGVNTEGIDTATRGPAASIAAGLLGGLILMLPMVPAFASSFARERLEAIKALRSAYRLEDKKRLLD